VHFPKKKVPYNELNCPKDKARDQNGGWIERMPRLAEFNEILVNLNKETIKWK
jgi:hypothetical protein